MSKRFLSWLLALTMLLLATPAWAEDFVVIGDEPAGDEIVEIIGDEPATETIIEDLGGEAGTETIIEDLDDETTAPAPVPTMPEGPTEVVVGSVNQMSGHFFTDMWGNNTADIDVRTLLHGYATIAISQSGTYQVDETVVAELSVTGQSNSQDKTYELEIQPGMTYNDGTPITAADYVFSVLLQAAPEIYALGGIPSNMGQFVGFEAYNAGETNVFSGVRLLDEMRLALVISEEALPYFYELLFMNITPYPIHVLAPDFEVADDGEGAYLRYTGTGEAPALADVYQETILNPETGYLYNPKVTSGPYQLVEYDAETHTASFEINPWYQGNFEGRKPTIDSIVFKPVTNETLLDELTAGTVDIVNKVSAAAVIGKALPMLAQPDAGFAAINYLRAGYGFIGLACELGVTQSVNVRQAMAYLTDADAYVAQFLASFAMRTYSYYGYGQWMATGMLEQINTEMNPYTLDVDAAIALLEKDGFTLNADGSDYDAQAGGVRYRKAEDGTLESLTVRWAALSDNPGCSILMTHTIPYMEQAGFEVLVDEMSFSEMLTHYYRQTDRVYNMFYLATNFDYIFDPYYTFHPGEAYQGERNTSGIADEKLFKLADELRRTEVGDNETYLERWFELQMRYNELLPTIPLYSNVYFDFYSTQVYSYLPNAYTSWASAILYATYGYAEQPVPEEGDLLLEDDGSSEVETVEIIE